MKKLLRYADGLVLMAGALAMMLRIWLLRLGPDAKGLYPANHASTILLIILSFGILIFFYLLSRHAGGNRNYQANFPASIIGALGMALAALGIAWYSLTLLEARDGFLCVLTGLLGLLTGIGLLIGALLRHAGKRPHYFVYLLPCLFFALRLFYIGKTLGDEPEATRYMLAFLASIAMIPTFYQFWGFCVGDGNRRNCLFWSLLTAFLSLAAVPANEHWQLYMSVALWLVTGLPVLQYLPRRHAPMEPLDTAEAEPEPEATEDVPPQMPQEPAPSDAPAAETAPVVEAESVSAPAAEEEFDPDAFLEELFREIDRKLEDDQLK